MMCALNIQYHSVMCVYIVECCHDQVSLHAHDITQLDLEVMKRQVSCLIKSQVCNSVLVTLASTLCTESLKTAHLAEPNLGTI